MASDDVRNILLINSYRDNGEGRVSENAKARGSSLDHLSFVDGEALTNSNEAVQMEGAIARRMFVDNSSIITLNSSKATFSVVGRDGSTNNQLKEHIVGDAQETDIASRSKNSIGGGLGMAMKQQVGKRVCNEVIDISDDGSVDESTPVAISNNGVLLDSVEGGGTSATDIIECDGVGKSLINLDLVPSTFQASQNAITPFKLDSSGFSGNNSSSLVPTGHSMDITIPKHGPAVVGAFTVQCAACLKWRLIPTKEQYEEIRQCILEKPWVCERASSWRPGASCSDSPDVAQDTSRLWAIDKPNIPCTPPGWKRLVVIRSEGSTRFADIYYQGPSGKKLRSLPEVERFLADHPEYIQAGVDVSQFSFASPRPLDDTYVKRKTQGSPMTGSIDNKRIRHCDVGLIESSTEKVSSTRETKVVLETPPHPPPLYRFQGLGPLQPLAFFHPSDRLLYRMPLPDAFHQITMQPEEVANHSSCVPVLMSAQNSESNAQPAPPAVHKSSSVDAALI